MEQDKTDKLIEHFVQAAITYHNATMSGKSKIVNRQAKRLHQIFLEIIEIGEDARSALLSLTDHKDDSVALMAATYSLKYDTLKAKSALSRLAKENHGIIGFGAEQALMRWEEGAWQLE